MMLQPLTVNQTKAAQLLGVSTRTIYNYEQAGLLQRSNKFKSARYSVEQLQKLAKGESA